jgi:hypothetical protein
MVVISTNNYSPYGIACILCNDSVIAPNLSEYASETPRPTLLVLRKVAVTSSRHQSICGLKQRAKLAGRFDIFPCSLLLHEHLLR